MEGKLQDQFVSILTDMGSNYIYVSLEIIGQCNLVKEVHGEPWSVQLEIRTKRRIKYSVRSCMFELSDMPTMTHLDVLSLGAYNILLGMDFLYLHITNVDCYEKEIECLNEQGEIRVMQVRKILLQ